MPGMPDAELLKGPAAPGEEASGLRQPREEARLGARTNPLEVGSDEAEVKQHVGITQAVLDGSRVHPLVNGGLGREEAG